MGKWASQRQVDTLTDTNAMDMQPLVIYLISYLTLCLRTVMEKVVEKMEYPSVGSVLTKVFVKGKGLS